jgi:hypothetical protein
VLLHKEPISAFLKTEEEEEEEEEKKFLGKG